MSAKPIITEVALYAKKQPTRARFKSRKPIQRKAPKKRLKRQNKASEIKKLKKELWELCKQIIRLKYGNTCYTCEAPNLAGPNWQTGHFIPSSICGLYLRFDLRNLRPQCFRCNISLRGNGTAFYRRLVLDCGQPYVDGVFSDKGKIVKGDLQFFAEKVAEYRAILEGVENPAQPTEPMLS